MIGMSAAEIATFIAAVLSSAVVVIGAIWTLLVKIVVNPIASRLDTQIYLLSEHHHGNGARAQAPIRGGANGEDSD